MSGDAAVLFHIASVLDWASRGQHYCPDAFSADGFIHCSTSEQLAGVAGRFFRGRDDLVLLSIDADCVTAPVRYENLEGGDERFPHLYGPLNVDAVLAADPLQVDAAGMMSGTST